jgi:hypothetical protein
MIHICLDKPLYWVGKGKIEIKQSESNEKNPAGRDIAA